LDLDALIGWSRDEPGAICLVGIVAFSIGREGHPVRCRRELKEAEANLEISSGRGGLRGSWCWIRRGYGICNYSKAGG